jgi:hypothetical protein
VRQAREGFGTSWTTLGWVTGLTADGARKRWADDSEQPRKAEKPAAKRGKS